jgi:hypothetical protein
MSRLAVRPSLLTATLALSAVAAAKIFDAWFAPARRPFRTEPD